MSKSSGIINHAFGLHLHQPPGNMQEILSTAEHEGIGIIHAYDRIVKYAGQHRDVAKIHVGMSGILLDQLTDPKVKKTYAKYLNIDEMLQRYRQAENIELLGMGHFHPVFPLIPKEDWEEQLIRGRKSICEILGREPEGFWPPEMAFTMEMIPYIVKAGYKYLVADSFHLKPEKKDQSGQADMFSAYLAEYKGYEIPVVPRNRDISNAQESGMDATWFRNEVLHKVKENPNSHKPRLVCTWSDGENGGWFRRMDEDSGFWGHFYTPFMDQVRSEGIIKPIKISEYLTLYPPKEKADIDTGAWNVASTSGEDFSQWNGSDLQKEGVAEINEVSRMYRHLLNKNKTGRNHGINEKFIKIREQILEAETSCFLFWGDDWVPKLYDRTRPVRILLNEISNSL